MGSPRGSPRGGKRHYYTGKKKQTQLDENYSESGQTIGSLETYVRLWVAENCFEVMALTERSSRFACVGHVACVVGPLLLAGQFAAFYGEFVAVAVGASVWRRCVAGAFVEASVDATLLAALLVERLHRVEKKRFGNFEREIVATFAPTACAQMLVAASAAALFSGRDRVSSVLAAFAYLRAAQRNYDEVWKFQRSAAAVRRAALLDDLARCGAAVVACAHVVTGENVPASSAVSRLFATAPAAATEALDAWIFMDFVFLVVAVFAGGVSLKRCVFPAHPARRVAVVARTAYQAVIAAFFLFALYLDRKPQREVSRTADFNRRIDVMSRRMLDFGFAKDQAEPRFRPYARALVALSVLLALVSYHWHDDDSSLTSSSSLLDR